MRNVKVKGRLNSQSFRIASTGPILGHWGLTLVAKLFGCAKVFQASDHYMFGYQEDTNLPLCTRYFLERQVYL